MENGLLASPPSRSWSWADEYANHGVFLTNDIFVAEDFAESADNVDDDIYMSGVLIVKVNEEHLDATLLKQDTFYDNDSADDDAVKCFTYASNIHPEALLPNLD